MSTKAPTGWIRDAARAWLAALLALAPCACDALDPDALARHGVRVDGVSPGGPSLFEQPLWSQTSATLEKKLGPQTRALELRLHPDRLVVQALSAKNPSSVVQYVLRGEQVKGPVPVELRGDGKLDENLFALADLNFQAVPELVELAVEHVDPQDGQVDYVVIRRNFPFSHDVRFRVFVDSPRKNGHLDADVEGIPVQDAERTFERRH